MSLLPRCRVVGGQPRAGAFRPYGVPSGPSAARMGSAGHAAADVPTAAASRRVVCSAEPAATTAASAASRAPPGVLKLNLDTAEARVTLRLVPVPFGKGSAIVVQNIAEGCEAWRAGIRPGHRLTAISDPINLIQVWPLDHMVSARFVRESLRMRNAVSIRMDFDTSTDLLNPKSTSQEPEPTPEATTATAAGPEAAAASASGGDQAGSAGTGGAAAGVDALSSSEGAQAGADFLSRVTASIDEADAPPPQTLSEKMAEAYEQQQKDQAILEREKSVVQKRMDARKAHLSDVSERNDAPFFTGVAIAFLLVPAAVLTWAISSGYIDALARGYK